MVEFLQSEWTRLLWDAALVLLCPIVVNLIIPRSSLSSRSSLPHFCSLITPAASRWLLCPPPACYSARNGTFHSPVWHLSIWSRAGCRPGTWHWKCGWDGWQRSVTVAAGDCSNCVYKGIFFCQRTCVTGSLCGGVMGSLDILGRLDSVVMGINVWIHCIITSPELNVQGHLFWTAQGSFVFLISLLLLLYFLRNFTPFLSRLSK